jgi:hypothetical protein
MTLVAWAPLLVLSILEGKAWGGSVHLPFLYDVEQHARLLIALPLLIAGEIVIHRRVRLIPKLFLERGLIPDSARPRFLAAIDSAMHLRNSFTVEMVILVLVYVVGVGFFYRTKLALDVPSWYRTTAGGSVQGSLAGWWLACVSLPLFQFLLLRWYFRLFVLARFLWQVSRLELNIVPTHPDRCGGLGFLASVRHAFAPLLLAEGTVLAGVMANRIFYNGATLIDFKVELVGLVAVLVFAVLGPLLVFTPKLAAARRAGLREYGGLAQRYVTEFDNKWLRGGAPKDEPLIGSADIQSLADLASSFEGVQSMRLTPFTPRSVLLLAVTTLLPALPLTLTMVSLEQLLDAVANVIF